MIPREAMKDVPQGLEEACLETRRELLLMRHALEAATRVQQPSLVTFF